jgi:hypothetical protein
MITKKQKKSSRKIMQNRKTVRNVMAFYNYKNTVKKLVKSEMKNVMKRNSGRGA